MEKLGFKVISWIVLVCFFLTSIMGQEGMAYAQSRLPQPAMIGLTKPMEPVLLKGLTVNPDNPFQFDFLVDPGHLRHSEERSDEESHIGDPRFRPGFAEASGDDTISSQELEAESQKLIKYFLAALTTSDTDIWVNLSPYEQDRIIPEGFDQTQMGRDMLAQDYLLKQLTSSLMFPDSEVGAKFWDKIYQKAFEQYGTTDIPVDTFNKVWIVPDVAEVYEHNNTAYVMEKHLKVMLERDYVAEQASHTTHVTRHKEEKEIVSFPRKREPRDQNNSTSIDGSSALPAGRQVKASGDDTISISSKVIKEVIIPTLEFEINHGEHFAPLRQMYDALILSTWFKRRLADSVLGQVYVDQNKTVGVETAEKEFKQRIYDEYTQLFKEGVFNYVQEEHDQYTDEIIPRKYFAGGTSYDGAMVNIVQRDDLSSLRQQSFREQIDRAQIINVKTDVRARDSSMIAVDRYMEQRRKNTVDSPWEFQLDDETMEEETLVVELKHKQKTISVRQRKFISKQGVIRYVFEDVSNDIDVVLTDIILPNYISQQEVTYYRVEDIENGHPASLQKTTALKGWFIHIYANALFHGRSNNSGQEVPIYTEMILSPDSDDVVLNLYNYGRMSEERLAVANKPSARAHRGVGMYRNINGAAKYSVLGDWTLAETLMKKKKPGDFFKTSTYYNIRKATIITVVTSIILAGVAVIGFAFMNYVEETLKKVPPSVKNRSVQADIRLDLANIHVRSFQESGNTIERVLKNVISGDQLNITEEQKRLFHQEVRKLNPNEILNNDNQYWHKRILRLWQYVQALSPNQEAKTGESDKAMTTENDDKAPLSDYKETYTDFNYDRMQASIALYGFSASTLFLSIINLALGLENLSSMMFVATISMFMLGTIDRAFWTTRIHRYNTWTLKSRERFLRAAQVAYRLVQFTTIVFSFYMMRAFFEVDDTFNIQIPDNKLKAFQFYRGLSWLLASIVWKDYVNQGFYKLNTGIDSLLSPYRKNWKQPFGGVLGIQLRKMKAKLDRESAGRDGAMMSSFQYTTDTADVWIPRVVENMDLGFSFDLPYVRLLAADGEKRKEIFKVQPRLKDSNAFKMIDGLESNLINPRESHGPITEGLYIERLKQAQFNQLGQSIGKSLLHLLQLYWVHEGTHPASFSFVSMTKDGKNPSVFVRETRDLLPGHHLVHVVIPNRLGTQESNAIVTEAFFVNGVLLGYGVNAITKPDRKVDMGFHIYKETTDDRYGRGKVPGLSSAIFKQRVRLLQDILPEEEQMNLYIHFLQYVDHIENPTFYLNEGFKAIHNHTSFGLSRLLYDRSMVAFGNTTVDEALGDIIKQLPEEFVVVQDNQNMLIQKKGQQSFFQFETKEGGVGLSFSAPGFDLKSEEVFHTYSFVTYNQIAGIDIPIKYRGQGFMRVMLHALLQHYPDISKYTMNRYNLILQAMLVRDYGFGPVEEGIQPSAWVKTLLKKEQDNDMRFEVVFTDKAKKDIFVQRSKKSILSEYRVVLDETFQGSEEHSPVFVNVELEIKDRVKFERAKASVPVFTESELRAAHQKSPEALAALIQERTGDGAMTAEKRQEVLELYSDWRQLSGHLMLLTSTDLELKFNGLSSIYEGLEKRRDRDHTKILLLLSDLYEDLNNSDKVRKKIIDILIVIGGFKESFVMDFIFKRLRHETSESVLISLVNGIQRGEGSLSGLNYEQKAKISPYLIPHFYSDNENLLKGLASFYRGWYRDLLLEEEESVVWANEYVNDKGIFYGLAPIVAENEQLKMRIEELVKRNDYPDMQQVVLMMMKRVGMAIPEGVVLAKKKDVSVSPIIGNVSEEVSVRMQLVGAEKPYDYFFNLLEEHKHQVIFVGGTYLSFSGNFKKALESLVSEGDITHIAVPFPPEKSEQFEQYLRGEIEPWEWEYNFAGDKWESQFSGSLKEVYENNSGKFWQVGDVLQSFVGKVTFVYYGSSEDLEGEIGNQQRALYIREAFDRKLDKFRMLVVGDTDSMARISTQDFSYFPNYSVAEEVSKDMPEVLSRSILLGVHSAIQFRKNLKLLGVIINENITKPFGLRIENELGSFVHIYNNKTMEKLWDGFMVWDIRNEERGGEREDDFNPNGGVGMEASNEQELVDLVGGLVVESDNAMMAQKNKLPSSSSDGAVQLVYATSDQLREKRRFMVEYRRFKLILSHIQDAQDSEDLQEKQDWVRGVLVLLGQTSPSDKEINSAIDQMPEIRKAVLERLITLRPASQNKSQDEEEFHRPEKDDFIINNSLDFWKDFLIEIFDQSSGDDINDFWDQFHEFFYYLIEDDPMNTKAFLNPEFNHEVQQS